MTVGPKSFRLSLCLFGASKIDFNGIANNANENIACKFAKPRKQLTCLCIAYLPSPSPQRHESTGYKGEGANKLFNCEMN